MRKSVFINLVIIISLAYGVTSFAAPAKKNTPKKPVPKKVEKKKTRARNEIKYIGFSAKRDPFCPPAKIAVLLEKPEKIGGVDFVPKDIKLPDIDLQGIIWSKKVPQVIINGSVMKVGEFIDDFEIKEIKRNGIILFFKGNDYFIKMMGFKRSKKKKYKKR